MKKMNSTVYTVHAYRWGDRERHSYTVGVYSKKHAALKAAQTESDYRGGKYECEVLGWTLDSGTEGRHDINPRAVLALPQMSTLVATYAAKTMSDYKGITTNEYL